MTSTASDLNRFFAALLAGGLLRPAELARDADHRCRRGSPRSPAAWA